MSMTQTSRRDGRIALAALFGFFALFVAVDIVFAIVAVRTSPGEIVQKSYLQGLHYNETLSDRAEQAALGWRASAALQPAASGSETAIVEVRLVDSDGAPVRGAMIEGSLRRPAQGQHDRPLQFIGAGEGVYRAEAPALDPGAWRLEARAEAEGGRALDFERSFAWRMPSR